ncbi:hypothetical protein NMY22_g17778 [Coprinellus aureogranulatus]|nr:hypothetical protein NMY22_g17778 [Coprinellus aureogranulatus]
MPVSSRRKPTNRRMNSEDIEEERPTQDHPMEGVESDEDAAPRSSAKKGKATTKSSSQKKREKKEPQAEDDASDDDEVIDVNSFTDQPVPKTQAQYLKGLAEDWRASDLMIRQNWSVLQKIGEGLADIVDGDEEPEEITELDNIMRELIDISAEFQSSHRTLEELHQKIVVNDEEVADLKLHYTEGYTKRNEEYAKKTTRQKYAKVPEYIDFKSAVWNAMHPDTPMPPLTNLIEKEAGDESDSDDELEMGGQTQDYKCPITLGLLKDPLTATGCKHSFSAEAIRETFAGKGKGALIPCPAAGCRQRISYEMCKPNAQLAKRVKAYERRIARQEEQEHSDVEEVID